MKRKPNKSHKFIKLQCSPSNKTKKYSCYSDTQLKNLQTMWNARHPDSIINTNDPNQIWNELKHYFKNTCNKESCWLKQFAINSNNEIYESFAPKSPKEWKKNPNEWLSSTDITDVMKQYEKKYKCFDFIGPSPIDFDKKVNIAPKDFDAKLMEGECVWDELCKFDLKKQIANGKHKIGFIFNTDPHDKDGEHWVSMFVNIKLKTIFYFDSAGDKVKPEIKQLADRIIEQGKGVNIDFTFDQNHPFEHQQGGTECGIYSLYFIAHMLEDKTNAKYLKTHVLSDKYMEKFRKIFFNTDL